MYICSILLNKHTQMNTTKQISTPDDLRQRVLNVKDKLPRRYTELMIDNNKNLKGKEDKIRKVVSLLLVDEEITVALENFVESLN